MRSAGAQSITLINILWFWPACSIEARESSPARTPCGGVFEAFPWTWLRLAVFEERRRVGTARAGHPPHRTQHSRTYDLLS